MQILLKRINELVNIKTLNFGSFSEKLNLEGLSLTIKNILNCSTFMDLTVENLTNFTYPKVVRIKTN